jgi:group II intron reverse transcriptase/maturase
MGARQARERKTGGGGTGRAKETKRAGKVGRDSERPVVPRKRGNQPKRDPVEGRGRHGTELLEGKMQGTSSSGSVSTKLERIANLAREMPGATLTTLAHHIDVDWLREAHRRTRKSGAAGVDGETSEAYAANLEDNLRSLLDRAKSGTYRAPPVRRVHIPKADGKETRPIGIPTFEDKVLQRAVQMVLEAVYEQEFLDCSYGFRHGKSAHQMLADIQHRAVRMAGGWVLEVDIRKFFDTLDHQHLGEILQKRVRDGVLLRLIGKWLKAGVLEDGALEYPEEGTPQGGVISPLLANIYLHEVLDAWFEREVKPRLRGPSFLFRYADDFIILFREEEDALRVLDVLPKRFGRYGLTLHPEKTRLVEFRRPGPPRPWGGDGGEPGSFELLGFNHHWARSRAKKWVVKQTTSKSRFSRAMKKVAEWCRRSRHRPMREQWEQLREKVRGHWGYYGIIGNSRALARFLYEVERCWHKWLNRRSQRGNLSWERMRLLLKRYPLRSPRLRVPTRSEAVS